MDPKEYSQYATLNIGEPRLTLRTTYTHTIDWDKVDTFEDVKLVLQEFPVWIDPTQCSEKLKPYIKEAQQVQTTP